jgi:hypothetical protein
VGLNSLKSLNLTNVYPNNKNKNNNKKKNNKVKSKPLELRSRVKNTFVILDTCSRYLKCHIFATENAGFSHIDIFYFAKILHFAVFIIALKVFSFKLFITNGDVNGAAKNALLRRLCCKIDTCSTLHLKSAFVKI